jgi:acetyl esterase
MGEEGSMPLDPQAQVLLEQMKAQGMPPFDQMTVAQAREAGLAFKDLEDEPQPVAKVEDHLIPSPRGELALGVRVYTPTGEPPFPLLVYFHGSGWTIANVEVGDAPCRALANAAGAVVTSVEYRLGPEHKFPAPLEDCYLATRWVAEHAADLGGDADRLVVIGDSAGGNLAAAVALMARDRGGPKISQQVLLYPATNHSFDTPSYQENADGYMLTRESCRWFWANYLNSDEDGRNPYASPLQADDLAGLPPAFIVTCEYDPLRDEGEAYGERLRAAGVPARVSRYDGMIHGFLWMGGVLDRTRHLIEKIAAEVRAAPKPLPTVPV